MPPADLSGRRHKNREHTFKLSASVSALFDNNEKQCLILQQARQSRVSVATRERSKGYCCAVVIPDKKKNVILNIWEQRWPSG